MTDTATALTAHHVPADLPTRIQHYIDGEFVDSVDGDTFDVLDPVTNETYLQAAAGKKADIDRAVAAARHAFTEGPWPRMLDLVHAEWGRLGHLRDSTFSFVPGRAQESVREHENILVLIETGAPLGEIEKAARRHRSATLDAYMIHEHPDEALGLPAF